MLSRSSEVGFVFVTGWAALQQAQRRLGETILDPSLWPSVMDAICAAVGAGGCLLFQTDVPPPDMPRTDSLDETMRAYFAGGWQSLDIRAERGVPLLMSGRRVFSDADILTREELERSAFINECILPRGFKWAAGVAFSAGQQLWALGFHRTVRQGPFEPDDSRLLESLPDRLTEVATLANAIGRIALTGAIDALDLVARPAIALDRFGSVLGANRAAEAMFSDDLRVRNRRLSTSDPEARLQLRLLADRLCTTQETEPLSVPPIAFRRDEGARLSARVLPVHPA